MTCGQSPVLTQVACAEPRAHVLAFNPLRGAIAQRAAFSGWSGNELVRSDRENLDPGGSSPSDAMGASRTVDLAPYSFALNPFTRNPSRLFSRAGVTVKPRRSHFCCPCGTSVDTPLVPCGHPTKRLDPSKWADIQRPLLHSRSVLDLPGVWIPGPDVCLGPGRGHPRHRSVLVCTSLDAQATDFASSAHADGRHRFRCRGDFDGTRLRRIRPPDHNGLAAVIPQPRPCKTCRGGSYFSVRRRGLW